MANITDGNKTGTSNYYASTSKYNADDYHIRTVIDKLVNTAFIARIDACTSSGEGGAKTVSATPLICEIDGDGDSLSMPSYQSLPHYRFQGGVAAFIADPQPGDLGVFICMKRDSSGLSSSSSTPQKPATYRKFNLADAVMVATIQTKAPTVWIHVQQDNKITIHAPAGVTIETDATCNIKASSVNIDAPTTTVTGLLAVQGGMTVAGGSGASVDGSLTATGDVTASGISLNSHTHTGDSGGTTSGPH